MTHFKKSVLFIVGIMYVLPGYTMNGNVNEYSKNFLDHSFYATPKNIDLLKEMLVHNADPNIEKSSGNTPLHLAALNRSPQCLAILLDAGAIPNKQNSYGATPLRYAVLERQYDSIQLLLKAKANPNLVNNRSETLLHAALNCFGNPQIIELLLSAKTNPNLQNIDGNTPLHKAASRSGVAQMLKEAQLLLQYGAQVDIVNNNQYTPLQLLATYPPTLRVREMGRLFVWHHYILLPHFIKTVPREIACIIASHVALLCAEQPTIWS